MDDLTTEQFVGAYSILPSLMLDIDIPIIPTTNDETRFLASWRLKYKAISKWLEVLWLNHTKLKDELLKWPSYAVHRAYAEEIQFRDLLAQQVLFWLEEHNQLALAPAVSSSKGWAFRVEKERLESILLKGGLIAPVNQHMIVSSGELYSLERQRAAALTDWNNLKFEKKEVPTNFEDSLENLASWIALKDYEFFDSGLFQAYFVRVKRRARVEHRCTWLRTLWVDNGILQIRGRGRQPNL